VLQNFEMMQQDIGVKDDECLFGKQEGLVATADETVNGV
jgi:hypothetical protein